MVKPSSEDYKRTKDRVTFDAESGNPRSTFFSIQRSGGSGPLEGACWGLGESVVCGKCTQDIIC